jgi:phage/plasmid-associated DNA primase
MSIEDKLFDIRQLNKKVINWIYKTCEQTDKNGKIKEELFKKERFNTLINEFAGIIGNYYNYLCFNDSKLDQEYSIAIKNAIINELNTYSYSTPIDDHNLFNNKNCIDNFNYMPTEKDPLFEYGFMKELKAFIINNLKDRIFSKPELIGEYYSLTIPDSDFLEGIHKSYEKPLNQPHIRVILNNILTSGSEVKGNKATLIGIILEPLLQIKKSYDPINKNDKQRWIYNQNIHKYELISGDSIGELLKRELNLLLPDTLTEKVANHNYDKITENPDLLYCINGLLNFKKYELESFNDSYLIQKQLGKYPLTILSEDELKLDRYKNTLIEKTLKKILIPKYDPGNIEMFMDFLERVVGAFQRNQKTLTAYIDTGDRGKSILNYILSLLFGMLFSQLTPEILRDQFNKEMLNAMIILSFDELTPDSFQLLWNIIKKITSGIDLDKKRDMHTTKYETITYGMLWIFSNYKPILNETDTAMLERMDILELPNHFVKSKRELKRNEYYANTNLKEELANDIDGLNWLISTIIIMGKHKKNPKSYRLSQDITTTLNIIGDTDPLKTFLKAYTEFDKYTETTNKEVLSRYEEYLKMIEKEDIRSEKTKQGKVGYMLSDLYKTESQELPSKDIKLTNKKGGTKYNIKLKEINIIKKELSKTYEINELSDNDYFKINDLSKETIKIYRMIEQEPCNLRYLEKCFPDIQVKEIIKELESELLIIPKEDETLTKNKKED